MRLSVIVPAYNEEANFKAGGLQTLFDYLQSQNYESEVIIVDDGSTDTTLMLLQQFAEGKAEVKVIANPHQGKSLTVYTGMLEAVGEWRLFTDFDQSTPISELEKMWPDTNSSQIIIGSRELQGSRRDKEPWYRHVMGRGFNFVVQLMTVKGIRDTQCGFKLFSRTAAETLFPKLKVTTLPSSVAFTGAFDVELLFLAQKFRFPITEVPIYWSHHETQRVSPLKDSMKMFAQVVRIWFTNLVGGYAA